MKGQVINHLSFDRQCLPLAEERLVDLLPLDAILVIFYDLFGLILNTLITLHHKRGCQLLIVSPLRLLWQLHFFVNRIS